MSARAGAGLVLAGSLLAAAAWAVDAQPAPRTSTSAAHGDPAAGLTIDRLDWSGAPAGARVLVVQNDYGDVRVRGSEGGELVEVHTVVQRLDSAGEKLALAVDRVGAALAIRVEYPAVAPPDPARRATRARLDRADVVVFAPEGVRLELRTRKGVVDVTEFEGEDVEAETESGAIRVVAERNVRARSTSGPIHVLVREAEGAKPMWLESESGSIEVELPSQPDLDVRARSGGKIEIGYPANVVSNGGQNRASFVLGKGERSLLVQSVSGAIRIAPAQPGRPVERGERGERHE